MAGLARGYPSHIAIRNWQIYPISHQMLRDRKAPSGPARFVHPRPQILTLGASSKAMTKATINASCAQFVVWKFRGGLSDLISRGLLLRSRREVPNRPPCSFGETAFLSGSLTGI